MPDIFLPVEPSQQKCRNCEKKGNLLLCSRCGETAYCSEDCQKKDWPSHKGSCKKTDRIDLDSFYPVFACIAEDVRMRVREPHIALRHKVINAPNPTMPAAVLPNGTYARVVELGEPISISQFRPDQSHWWPQGESPNVRGKLFRRITREGKVLPIAVGTCIAIMFKMYSTPNAATPITTRLRYKSSSLTDFGVISGKVRVIPDDQLVYILPNGTIRRGQDPNKHHWLYFTTQKGETVYLDCSLYTFNMCLGCVPTAYLPPDYAQVHSPLAPACFWDRTMRHGVRTQENLFTEQKRTSFLRDETLRRALESIDLSSDGEYDISPSTEMIFRGMMGKVKGNPDVSQDDFAFMMQTVIQGINLIGYALNRGKWKSFPAHPQMGIEGDPGELNNMPD